MYAPRVFLWMVGVAGLVLTFVFISTRSVAPVVVCVLLALTAPGAAEAYADRRRRNDWFSREFGDSDGFRQSVDADADAHALRQLRDEKGVAAAVLALRKQYPLLPLSEAARFVREM